MHDVGPLIDKGIDTAYYRYGPHRHRPIDTGLIGTGSVTRCHGLETLGLLRARRRGWKASR